MRSHAKLLLILLAVTAACLVAWGYQLLDLAGLHYWVLESGPVGWLLFVMIYGVLVALCLPITPINLLGGALFGPVLGLLLNALGATLGAGAAFLLARYSAREWMLKKLSGNKLNLVMHEVDRESWKFVAWTRLMPVFPFFLFNYLLGLTNIGFRAYVVATFFSLLPLCYVYTSLGHSGFQWFNGEKVPENLLWMLAMTGLISTALFALQIFYRRRSIAS